MMTFGVGYTLTVWTDHRPLQSDTIPHRPRKAYADTFWRMSYLTTCLSARCIERQPLHPLRLRPRTRRKGRRKERSQSRPERSPRCRAQGRLQDPDQACRAKQAQARHSHYWTGDLRTREQEVGQGTWKEVCNRFISDSIACGHGGDYRAG